MRSPIRFHIAVLTAAMVAVGCDFQHSSTLPSVDQSSNATGPSNSTTFVGTWSSTASGSGSNTPAPPTLEGCGNFVWAISSQTATNITGTFSATCLGGITMNASAVGIMTAPNAADLTLTGTANVSGQSCDFTITGNATLGTDALTMPYTGTTCFGPVKGTEVLHRTSAQAPPPPPDPTPAPQPPSPPPPPPPSAFDLPNSILRNSPFDLASWPITSTITELDMNAGGVHVEFSKRDGGGRWPDVTPPGWDGPLQYTLGMCLNIGGQWYCSATIEFWYGLDRSGGPPSGFANNWFYDPIRWAPMTGHQPVPGETIGFFVCAGDCRNNKLGDLSPVKERTNVVLVPMPSNDGGASFSFVRGTAVRR